MLKEKIEVICSECNGITEVERTAIVQDGRIVFPNVTYICPCCKREIEIHTSITFDVTTTKR